MEGESDDLSLITTTLVNTSFHALANSAAVAALWASFSLERAFAEQADFVPVPYFSDDDVDDDVDDEVVEEIDADS